LPCTPACSLSSGQYRLCLPQDYPDSRHRAWDPLDARRTFISYSPGYALGCVGLTDTPRRLVVLSPRGRVGLAGTPTRADDIPIVPPISSSSVSNNFRMLAGNSSMPSLAMSSPTGVQCPSWPELYAPIQAFGHVIKCSPGISGHVEHASVWRRLHPSDGFG